MTKSFFHIFMLFFVNDEWPMTNDKWKSVISYFFCFFFNDEWRMTNDKSCFFYFHSYFINNKWRMTNDEWRMTNDEWQMTKETLKETFSKETFWGRTKEQRNMKDLVKEKETFSSSPIIAEVISIQGFSSERADYWTLSFPNDKQYEKNENSSM